MEDVKERRDAGQPVLIGTTSIEKNEKLSRMLERQGIEHNVLNAKQHEREALIIAQAGHAGAVTAATNTAGRGVDIILGGNPAVEAKQEALAPDLEPDTTDHGALVQCFRSQQQTTCD